MNELTAVFVVFLAISVAVEIWLTRRQVAYVASRREAVPEAFRESITLEAHQKAADYTMDKGRVAQVEEFIEAGILLLFTLGGVIGWLQGVWQTSGLSPLWSGVGLIVSALVLMSLLGLPMSAYRTFVIETKHGFNRSTPVQFLKDFFLQSALSVAIGAPLVAVVLWVMDSLGSAWWVLAWAILVSFSLLLSWAFPTLIAPLFNKFTPLADQTLQSRIEALLSRCGFQSQGIFVMDGSKRSGHGNAYFTGFGDSKRIVFFDTLVNALEHDELEAVLAHELGHFKHKHVFKMLTANSVIMLVGFAVLGWLVEQAWFYHGLGVAEPSHAAALLLFALASPVFTGLLQPIVAYFQRRHEFEADDFAATQTRPKFLISALVKLYRDNASTLTPDPLYSAFHYSHPPAAIRIANLSSKAASGSA